jgi:hypothetical protein
LEAATGGVKGGGGTPGAAMGPAGNQQHFQHMQLEWLARTGMFYPRIPDLTGQYTLSYRLSCLVRLGAMLDMITIITSLRYKEIAAITSFQHVDCLEHTISQFAYFID